MNESPSKYHKIVTKNYSNKSLQKIEQYIFKNLNKNHNSTNTQYGKYIINDIIYNEKTHIVAKFKDYLILDDISEFLKRYYTSMESSVRLPKFYEYYETYSKIYPNYTSILEGKYIYKNIQKKQKMIDLQEKMELEYKANKDSISKLQKETSDDIFSTDVYNSILNDINVEDFENLFNIKVDKLHNGIEDDIFEENLNNLIDLISKYEITSNNTNNNNNFNHNKKYYHHSNCNITNLSSILLNNDNIVNNNPLSLRISNEHRKKYPNFMDKHNSNKIWNNKNVLNINNSGHFLYNEEEGIPKTDRLLKDKIESNMSKSSKKRQLLSSRRNNSTFYNSSTLQKNLSDIRALYIKKPNHIQKCCSSMSCNNNYKKSCKANKIVYKRNINTNEFIYQTKSPSTERSYSNNNNNQNKYKSIASKLTNNKMFCSCSCKNINNNNNINNNINNINHPFEQGNNFIYMINQNPKFTTNFNVYNNNNKKYLDANSKKIDYIKSNKRIMSSKLGSTISSSNTKKNLFSGNNKDSLSKIVSANSNANCNNSIKLNSNSKCKKNICNYKINENISISKKRNRNIIKNLSGIESKNNSNYSKNIKNNNNNQSVNNENASKSKKINNSNYSRGNSVGSETSKKQSININNNKLTNSINSRGNSIGTETNKKSNNNHINKITNIINSIGNSIGSESTKRKNNSKINNSQYNYYNLIKNSKELGYKDLNLKRKNTRGVSNLCKNNSNNISNSNKQEQDKKNKIINNKNIYNLITQSLLQIKKENSQNSNRLSNKIGSKNKKNTNNVINQNFSRNTKDIYIFDKEISSNRNRVINYNNSISKMNYLDLNSVKNKNLVNNFQIKGFSKLFNANLVQNQPKTDRINFNSSSKKMNK